MYPKTLPCLLLAVVAWLFASPSQAVELVPGALWRDYASAPASTGMFRIGGRFGGAQNLERVFPLSRGRHDPVPMAIDLAGAIRAELIVGYNQTHSGSPLLHVALNDGPYRLLPLPKSITNRGFFFHVYPAVEIPLAEIRPEGNTFRFTSQKKLDSGDAYEAGYDQSLVYEIILRVFYDPASKEGPTGRMTAPAEGGVLDATGGKRPVLEAKASSPNGVGRVDFVGRYADLDRGGDNRDRPWHVRWKHFRRDPFLMLVDQIGSVLAPPFRTTWDMTWIPDQAEPMEVSAIVTDDSGLSTFLQPVGGVRLVRTDRSVEFARPYNTPPAFNSRSSKLLVSNFAVAGDLRLAREARLVFEHWAGSGNDGKGFRLNGRHHPTFRPWEAFPVSLLQAGENTLDPDQGGHHGMEILWPGVGALIAYELSAKPVFLEEPQDAAILPGGLAVFSARVAGVPEPSYLWEISRDAGATWSAVPDQQSPRLELAGLGSEADKSLVRLVADHPLGKVHSRPALLRVAPILPSFQPVDGRIVFEAESFDGQVIPENEDGWMIVGDRTLPEGAKVLWNYYDNNTQTEWGAGATVSYRFRNARAGSLTAWFLVRNRVPGKNHNILVGVGGQAVGPVLANKEEAGWQWRSLLLPDLPAGELTLDVMRRADGLIIDRIVLSEDPGFSPALGGLGESLPVSPRDCVVP